MNHFNFDSLLGILIKRQEFIVRRLKRENLDAYLESNQKDILGKLHSKYNQRSSFKIEL
jgi:hypothetical protein